MTAPAISIWSSKPSCRPWPPKASPIANTPGLIERVAERARELDGGYFPGGTRHRIIRPRLGSDAGITGALMLAESAAKA